MANLNPKFKLIQGHMLKINDMGKEFTKTARQPSKELFKIISRMAKISPLKNITIYTRDPARTG